MIERESARILLLNARNELLMFGYAPSLAVHPQPPEVEWCWMTPGGGREAGETWDDTARRELWEETGLDAVRWGPWVWEIEHRFWSDDVQRLNRDRFVVAHVERDAISLDHQTAEERSIYQVHRWWSPEAMRASRDVFFPVGLADLVDPIIAGQYPEDITVVPSDLREW